MRDSLVAIDAGLALLLGFGMIFLGPRFLLIAVHRFEAMAIPAFPGAAFFHSGPFMACHLHAFGFKFFLGIYDTCYFPVKLGGGLNLADNLMRPILGHMTVTANGSYTRTIGKMRGLLVFGEDIVTHLVATDTKLQGVCSVHPRLKTGEQQQAAKKSTAYQQHGHEFIAALILYATQNF